MGEPNSCFAHASVLRYTCVSIYIYANEHNDIAKQFVPLTNFYWGVIISPNNPRPDTVCAEYSQAGCTSN